MGNFSSSEAFGATAFDDGTSFDDLIPEIDYIVPLDYAGIVYDEPEQIVPVGVSYEF